MLCLPTSQERPPSVQRMGSAPARRVRMACDYCGARVNVMVQAGFHSDGQCGNCGSYRIVPLPTSPSTRRRQLDAGPPGDGNAGLPPHQVR